MGKITAVHGLRFLGLKCAGLIDHSFRNKNSTPHCAPQRHSAWLKTWPSKQSLFTCSGTRRYGPTPQYKMSWRSTSLKFANDTASILGSTKDEDSVWGMELDHSHSLADFDGILGDLSVPGLRGRLRSQRKLLPAHILTFRWSWVPCRTLLDPKNRDKTQRTK